MSYQIGVGFEEAEIFFGQIKDGLKGEATVLKKLHLAENDLRYKGRELSRRLLQGYLNNCGDGNVGADVLSSMNVRLTHRLLMKRTIRIFFRDSSATPVWLFNSRTS